MTRAEKFMLIGMYIAASADIIIAAGIWIMIIARQEEMIWYTQNEQDMQY